MPRVSQHRSHVDDLRGAGRLAVEATAGVTDLVRDMHRTIASGPALLGKPLAGPVSLLTGLVYGSIRGVAGVVGAGLDATLAQLGPLLGASVPGPGREAVLAALNGVLGDYLGETGNPLAIQMQARCERREGARLLVLVHGSCMSGRQWTRHGHDHGAALARDLGYTPVYIDYNSGLHVSTNGRALAGLLEQLVSGWPCAVDELSILAHSMGGLVARSACHVAEGEGAVHLWRRKLRKLVFLGTPHHGSPLERGGNILDVLLEISAYSAPFARLGRIRSAGVTDLRFGNLLDAHWQGRDRFAPGADARRAVPLPAGVECHAIAATTALEPAGRLPGDGLVPVESALGMHERSELTLPFADDHKWIGLGMKHLDLLDRPEVYQRLRSWFEA